MNPGRCYGRAIAVFSSALALLVAAHSANGAVTVYTFSDTTLFNTAGSGTISGSFDFDPFSALRNHHLRCHNKHWHRRGTSRFHGIRLHRCRQHGELLDEWILRWHFVCA